MLAPRRRCTPFADSGRATRNHVDNAWGRNAALVPGNAFHFLARFRSFRGRFDRAAGQGRAPSARRGGIRHVGGTGSACWSARLASHTLIVPSASLLTRRLPSGLNATLLIALVCPVMVKVSWPLLASHTLSVLSELPL